MDYPKSDPSVGLINGKFTDGNPSEGVPASIDPSSWANQVTDELLNVLALAGIDPDEGNSAQLAAAIAMLMQGRLLNIQVISSSQLYTRSPGARMGRIRMWGGGAGGQGGTDTQAGSGGGGGGYCEGWLELPETANATVGAAGSAGAINALGGSGGTSSFLSMEATGGVTATTGGSSSSGVGTGGYMNVAGSPGRGSFTNDSGAGQGGSAFGSPGGNPHYTVGSDGISPGGGGAGGGSVAGAHGVTSAGGKGGAGLIVVEEYS